MVCILVQIRFTFHLRKSHYHADIHVTIAAYKLKEAAFNRLSLAPNTLSQRRKHDDLGQELQKIEVSFRLASECQGEAGCKRSGHT